MRFTFFPGRCDIMCMDTDLDAADRTIVRLLQADAHVRLDALADATGLSVATVQRRAARLRRAGVILGATTVLDPAALEQAMTFVVAVEMERERPDQLDAFAHAAVAEPQVQQCHYVTGEGDFMLICTAADMAGFEDLTRRLLLGQPNVRRFRTSVVMRTHERTLAVPVEP